LNSDGSYSYTPPATLAEGTTLTETFNYTITDDDGDTSSSTLTITVDRLPAAVADTDSATEGGSATTGNVITNDDEGNTNATVTAADQGGSTITVGVAFTTDAGGSLTLNSDGSYSYTPPASLTEGGTITETINYTITDNDGDTSSSTLSITVDRLPAAVADTDSAVEGGSATTGNVITNDDEGNTSATVTAADQGGSAITVGSAFTTDAGGSLTLNSDGSYSYTPPATLGEGGTVTETFNYTITDNDGDTSSSTLTITVAAIPSVEESEPEDESWIFVYSVNQDHHEYTMDRILFRYGRDEWDFTLPPTPVYPTYSGWVEPGSTVVVTLNNAFGGAIGETVVMADAAGNWTAQFPAVILSEDVHSITLTEIAASYNNSTRGQFNTRVYFAPSTHDMVYYRKELTVEGVLGETASLVFNSMQEGFENPLLPAWNETYAYEYLTSSAAFGG
jgi:VCBS repeat-containing protein